MSDDRVKVSRRTGFTVLQDAVIDREDLGAMEKLAYMALCRHADKAGDCFPSYGTIAKKMSASRRSAMRAVKGLVAKGLVVYEEQQRRNGADTAHLYTVVDNLPETPTNGATESPGGVTESHRGGDTESLLLKDSQGKDSQLEVRECRSDTPHQKQAKEVVKPDPWKDASPEKRELLRRLKDLEEGYGEEEDQSLEDTTTQDVAMYHFMHDPEYEQKFETFLNQFVYDGHERHLLRYFHGAYKRGRGLAVPA